MGPYTVALTAELAAMLVEDGFCDLYDDAAASSYATTAATIATAERSCSRFASSGFCLNTARSALTLESKNGAVSVDVHFRSRWPSGRYGFRQRQSVQCTAQVSQGLLFGPRSSFRALSFEPALGGLDLPLKVMTSRVVCMLAHPLELPAIRHGGGVSHFNQHASERFLVGEPCMGLLIEALQELVDAPGKVIRHD